MRATIIIEKKEGIYRGSAIGKFGGGYRFAFAGASAAEAGAFAAREMARYAITNSEGGDLVAPPEIMEIVPAQLRSVEARKREKMGGRK